MSNTISISLDEQLDFLDMAIDAVDSEEQPDYLTEIVREDIKKNYRAIKDSIHHLKSLVDFQPYD